MLRTFLLTFAVTSMGVSLTLWVRRQLSPIALPLIHANSYAELAGFDKIQRQRLLQEASGNAALEPGSHRPMHFCIVTLSIGAGLGHVVSDLTRGGNLAWLGAVVMFCSWTIGQQVATRWTTRLVRPHLANSIAHHASERSPLALVLSGATASSQGPAQV